MSALEDLQMVMRLTRDFRAFAGTPVAGPDVITIIERQLRIREQRFLYILDHLVDRHAQSPYRWLMQAAGMELDDIRSLVAQRGLDFALNQMCEAGVYLTYDEFKGRREVVRGSQRRAFTETDFDNPRVRAHLESRTGGTRGPATRLKLNLPFIGERALATAIACETHNLRDHDFVIWQLGGIRPILQYCRAGKPPIAWFYPVAPLPLNSHLITRYLDAVARLSHRRVPRPRFLDLRDPDRMVEWLTRQGPVCLSTYASSAARVAGAATERGVGLDNVVFIAIGEPFTDAKKKTIESAGARAVVGYGLHEAGTVGFGCATPRVADDVHLLAHAYGLVQRKRPIGPLDLTVDAFLVTSLISAGPKVMINVESGDYGHVERRDCGCLLGRLGLNTHLSLIRSFEKLTTEGATFVRSDLIPIIEDVLPRRFGGGSTDYQLVESGPDGAGERLSLLVSPRVGEVDEHRVREVFLEELNRDGWSERLMAGLWRRAGTLHIERRDPIPTRAGKVLPFQVRTEP